MPKEKLSDFGISTLRKGIREQRNRTKKHLSHLKKIQKSRGTRIYASPAFKKNLTKEIQQTEKLIKKLK